MRSRSTMAQHRQSVPWRVYDQINKRSCLHIDAWIVQDSNDALFLVIETRAGGHAFIAQRVYALAPDQMTPVVMHSLLDVNGAAYVKRRIGTKWASKNYPWLSDLHRERIQPELHAPVEGFKGFRSIALHYVWSDPAVSNPFEGIANYWNSTGYADAWGKVGDVDGAPRPLTAGEVKAATKRKAATWSRADRSMLRTLDKIIKA